MAENNTETVETAETTPAKAPAKTTPAKTKAAEKAAQVTLFSKGDIAEMMGMTTQALTNRSTRDPLFPKPTYSNASETVQLFTKDDVKAIHEYLTKGERERLEKLNKAMGALG
jgi:hypothetical protein